MVILQMQFKDVRDDEQMCIVDFLQWLISIISGNLTTKVMRKKIRLRLTYVQDNVNWITWLPNKRYNTSVDDMIDAMVKSFTVKQYKDNVWKIETSDMVQIPNSITPISKFIRFLNYGDSKFPATGVFTNLCSELHGSKIKGYWDLFIYKEFGRISQANVIM